MKYLHPLLLLLSRFIDLLLHPLPDLILIEHLPKEYIRGLLLSLQCPLPGSLLLLVQKGHTVHQHLQLQLLPIHMD